MYKSTCEQLRNAIERETKGTSSGKGAEDAVSIHLLV